MQYVSKKTNQYVLKHMNCHRIDISKYYNHGYASNVALHFYSDSHSIADFRFLAIDDFNTILQTKMSAHPFLTNVHKLVLIHMAPTDVLAELATRLKATDTRVEVILECIMFSMVIRQYMYRCFRIAFIV